MNSKMNALKIIGLYFLSAFLGAVFLYEVLKYVLPEGYVFFIDYKMIPYHYLYSYQYLALLAFFYSVILFLMSNLFPQRHFFFIYISSIMVTVFICSPLGGLLWVLHDMQAGYFLTGERLQEYFLWGAKEGFLVGWKMIIFSMPYNIILFIGLYFVSVLIWKRGVRNV
jgi:hypothetical protein